MSIHRNRLILSILFIAALIGGIFFYLQKRAVAEGSYPYTLPALPYAYDDLEPYIDAATMIIHHTKHHQAYIDKLNGALKDQPMRRKPLDYLLSHLEELPQEIRTTVKNNGGGHYNHSFFWRVMTPEGNLEPVGNVKALIEEQFGSFEKFKEQFSAAAGSLFGSGWVWLVLDQKGKLQIIATPNQDSPLSQSLIPLLAVDLWEHAYYLKYQNERAAYLSAWWHVVNWEEVEKNFAQAKGENKSYEHDADSDEYE